MRRRLLSAAFLTLSVFTTPDARASWVQMRLTQSPGVQSGPRAVSDGASGVIVTWYDAGAGAVFAKHILASDNTDPAWPMNGLGIGAAVDLPAIATDGAGGAIVAWIRGTTTHDVYAHHVLANGTLDPAWPAAGVAVCTATGDQLSLQAVSDGAGGALLAWTDRRNSGVSGDDVYAHHVTAAGVADAAWPVNGLGICTLTGNQNTPVAVSDGSTGIIVAWTDFRSGPTSDIFAQRVLSTGVVATGWAAGGVVISDATQHQFNPRICTDGAGGAIVGWTDNRDGSGDVYAMRIRAAGSTATGWHKNGEILKTDPTNQELFSLVADGAGGAVAAWEDTRPGGYDIYAQRIGATGSVAWAAAGVAVCAASNDQVGPELAPDGSGGVYVAWHDLRFQTSTPPPSVIEIFLHHVLSTGTPDPGWPANGGRWTGDGQAGPYAIGMVSRGGGTATVIWAGAPTGAEDLYGLNINSSWPPRYSMSLAVMPAGTGSVSKSPDQVIYDGGTMVTVTATANAGYQFDHWSGSASGNQNPLTVTMDSDKTITANFSFAPPACGNWSFVSTGTIPSARVLAPMVWDPLRNRALMFGGFDGTNYLNDVWQLTIAQGWTELVPAGVPPSPRDAAGLIYDPVRDRMLVVMGNNVTPPQDVWALSLSGTPTWTQLTPTGTPPVGRFGFSTIYDPVRDRVLLFGGKPAPLDQRSDLWSLSLSGTPNWTQISPSSPPGPRYSHVAIYDPVRDRMIIHGGAADFLFTQAILGDTWALALGTLEWAQLPGPNPPPGMYYATAIYDPVRDRMLRMAGFGRSDSDMENGPVWSLSLEVDPFWTRLNIGGFPLGWRQQQSAVYDAQSDLVILANGQNPQSGAYVTEVRRLDCAGGWWLQTAGVHGTVTPYPKKTCYTNGENVTLQAVGQSGWGFEQWLGDASGTSPLINITMNDSKTIIAQFHQGTVAVEDVPLAFGIEAIHPNPASGPVQVSYSLTHSARVRMSVYDLAGRQVGSLVNAVLPPGRHTASWNARSDGAAPGAGVYFIRYETPAGTWARRIVLLR